MSAHPRRLFELHHGNAHLALAKHAVADGLAALIPFQVVLDGRAERARTLAVDNAHRRMAAQNRAGNELVNL